MRDMMPKYKNHQPHSVKISIHTSTILTLLERVSAGALTDSIVIIDLKLSTDIRYLSCKPTWEVCPGSVAVSQNIRLVPTKGYWRIIDRRVSFPRGRAKHETGWTPAPLKLNTTILELDGYRRSFLIHWLNLRWNPTKVDSWIFMDITGIITLHLLGPQMHARSVKGININD